MRRAFLLLAILLISGCVGSARFEAEALDVPVPQGGAFVLSDHTSRGTPRAHALYHYPRAESAPALLDEVQAAIEATGWDVKLRDVNETHPLGAPASPRGFLRAASAGRLLDAEVGRWTSDYGGCCVFTADASRPLGLYLTLYEDPANTA